nr:MAG TPA: hypothetical protein [Caudoviricetes sp.]DAW42004.1 MAG TPA: hypothetical protein [Caudoviricetes sp.]
MKNFLNLRKNTQFCADIISRVLIFHLLFAEHCISA